MTCKRIKTVRWPWANSWFTHVVIRPWAKSWFAHLLLRLNPVEFFNGQICTFLSFIAANFRGNTEGWQSIGSISPNTIKRKEKKLIELFFFFLWAFKKRFFSSGKTFFCFSFASISFASTSGLNQIRDELTYKLWL